MRRHQGSGLAVLALVWLVASTGCRSTYYALWETLGKEKRELLKDEVEEARDDQQKASEQFKDALTRLQEMYTVEGGELETTYRRLNSDYERCESRAKAVTSRIDSVEQIAADLFQEWEAEIQTYSNANLKTASQSRLQETKAKYQSLVIAMRKAEGGMEPVLVQFRDHVLYLKHNLNARAIGALKGEALDIEKEISALIKDMNQSISEADAFIASL